MLFPTGLVEVINKQFHFDVSFAFRVEMSARVAAHGFDEVVKAFRQVGGAEERMHASGIVKES